MTTRRKDRLLDDQARELATAKRLTGKLNSSTAASLLCVDRTTVAAAIHAGILPGHVEPDGSLWVDGLAVARWYVEHYRYAGTPGTRRGAGWSPADDDNLRTLAAQGLDLREIADRLKRSYAGTKVRASRLKVTAGRVGRPRKTGDDESPPGGED